MGSWLMLPKGYMLSVTDRQACLQAQVWMASAFDYEAHLKVDGEMFDEFSERVAEALKGFARSSGSGSGAWQEGEPWARLVRERHFGTLDLGADVPQEERAARALSDWEAAMGALSACARACLPEGRYFIVDKKMESPWASAPPGEAEGLGRRLMAIDEAAALAASSSHGSRAGAKPRL